MGPADPDLKGKVLQEICTVTVQPARRGSKFDYNHIDIDWRAARDFEGMSPATLRENRSAIRQFIEYLLSPDGAGSRKRWRMLAILEQGSKGPNGEIFLTPHGPVFVSRMTVDDERGYRAEDADNHQSPIRGIEPVTGEPGQLFDMASRRALFMVDAGYLIARIQAGDDTVVLRPRSHVVAAGETADGAADVRLPGSGRGSP